MFSQYGEPRPISAAEIGLPVWGTPANFNGFRVLASFLHWRRSTDINQTLHDVSLSSGLVHYYIHFWGLLPLTKFCRVQNSLCVQVLRSRRTLSGYTFAIEAYIDNRKKLVKHQYLPLLSSQYDELQPINGWDRLSSFGHPSKFQRVWRLGFVTAPTSLNGGQPNFAGCLAVSWAGIGLLYTVSQKKQGTTILSITSPNVDRFSNFFHWQIHW